ncbi:MAG: hypothetical protein Q8R55_05525, partial [Candidatus Taylorbacteria bacterium]|nr:hypothetical protein [Candidatus Taylorbacteria bacterium]
MKTEILKCKKLEEWLDGLSLKDKLKTLEKGNLLTCAKCGFTVFDKEKPEDWIRRRCVPIGYEHSFIESEYYIILKRSFTGIIDVACYYFGTPEEAVINYFMNK